MHSVSKVVSNDVWAVGLAFDNGFRLLIERWNGTSWSVVLTTNLNLTGSFILHSVAAIDANNVWAVGTITDTATNKEQTLILNWNGSNWLRVDSPNVSGQQCSLFAVTRAPNVIGFAAAVGFCSDLPDELPANTLTKLFR